MSDPEPETYGDPGDPAILITVAEAGTPIRIDDAFCHRIADGLRFVIRTGPTPSYAVTDAVTDAIRTLDALDIRRAHLFGGSVAYTIAVRYPDRVESLVLLGAGAGAGADLTALTVPTTVFVPTDEPVPAAPSVVVVRLDGTGPTAVNAVATALLMRTSGGWDPQGDRLAARSIEAGDSTGWFDRLYAAGAAGEVDMPWDRDDPHPLLASWVDEHRVRGTGRSAVVCGCGLGADAAFLAGLGFRTIGFDIATTAIRVARERHPDSRAHYQVADLLALPSAWIHAFDLVVDIFTAQALPDPPRRNAIVNIGRLVAPGGSLLVIALRGDDWKVVTPPWPLTPAEIDAFATDGLDTVRIEETVDPRRTQSARWRAEFRRPTAAGA